MITISGLSAFIKFNLASSTKLFLCRDCYAKRVREKTNERNLNNRKQKKADIIAKEQKQQELLECFKQENEEMRLEIEALKNPSGNNYIPKKHVMAICPRCSAHHKVSSRQTFSTKTPRIYCSGCRTVINTKADLDVVRL